MKKSIKTKYELKEYKFEKQLLTGTWAPFYEGFGINPLSTLIQRHKIHYGIIMFEKDFFLKDKFIVFKNPTNIRKDLVFRYEEIN